MGEGSEVGAFCPFCGDPRNAVERSVPFEICHVECGRCGAHGPVESAEDRALSAWNTRIGREVRLPDNAAKEFSGDDLQALAALSAFESNPVVRLANVSAYALTLRAELDQLKKENNALRLIAGNLFAKHGGQCHYCGVESIAQCPHGFPGCAVADDITVGEEEAFKQIVAERDQARQELEEAEGVIRALYDWAYAQTYELEQEQIVNYVTPEMASDAGDRSMVGHPIYGNMTATFCLAESGEPWRGLMESNGAVRRAMERRSR